MIHFSVFKSLIIYLFFTLRIEIWGTVNPHFKIQLINAAAFDMMQSCLRNSSFHDTVKDFQIYSFNSFVLKHSPGCKKCQLQSDWTIWNKLCVWVQAGFSVFHLVLSQDFSFFKMKLITIHKSCSMIIFHIKVVRNQLPQTPSSVEEWDGVDKTIRTGDLHLHVAQEINMDWNSRCKIKPHCY